MDKNSAKEYIEKKLKAGTYLSTKRNNILVTEFLKSKINGAFERLIYTKKINSDLTWCKKVANIKKIDEHFKVDFDTITEDSMIEYRDLLNKDKIFKDKTLIQWKEKKPGEKRTFGLKIEKTNKPLSYRSKKDYAGNFKEFWHFIMEYYYQDNKEKIINGELKELPDIMRYFSIRKPEDYENVKVEFIDNDDLTTLLNNIRNRNFKSFVQLSIMSGGRGCEVQKIKYGKNLYKNKDGEWIIHLPKIKGVSYKKFPIKIDMYEDELIPYIKSLNLKEGDYLFKFSDATVRKLMNHYTVKYVGKKYTPKILRKTARMIRTNAKYSEMWINKLMGHSPDNTVQKHYTNLEGIEADDDANERLKGKQYPSLKKDYDEMKMQMQAQQENMKAIQEKFNQILLVAKDSSIIEVEEEIEKKKSIKAEA